MLLSLRARQLCVTRGSVHAVRGLGSVPFSHHRTPSSGPIAPVRSVLFVPPPLSFPACRAASGGWYGTLADTALVHQVENLLVGVQQFTCLPWWASILYSTLAARTFITLPLAAYQIYITAKMGALQPEIAEMAKRLRYEVSVRGKERGWSEKHCRFLFKKNLRRLVYELYVKHNCHPFKASLLVWVQLPMWISLSLALRNLSMSLDPSLTALQGELSAGGALWFPDLTMPDSTWILPICLGLTNLLIIEIVALHSANRTPFSVKETPFSVKEKETGLQKFLPNFFRGVSLLMIPIAATVPSSMSLYWLGSSVVGLGQNLFLMSPAIRRVLGAHSPETPYRDLLTAFQTKYLKYFK